MVSVDSDASTPSVQRPHQRDYTPRPRHKPLAALHIEEYQKVLQWLFGDTS